MAQSKEDIAFRKSILLEAAIRQAACYDAGEVAGGETETY